MHEHDGTSVNSAAGDGADPESPRSEWGRRLSVGHTHQWGDRL